MSWPVRDCYDLRHTTSLHSLDLLSMIFDVFTCHCSAAGVDVQSNLSERMSWPVRDYCDLRHTTSLHSLDLLSMTFVVFTCRCSAAGVDVQSQ